MARVSSASRAVSPPASQVAAPAALEIEAQAKRRLASHPLAELFPMLDEPALGELAEDIRENGLREPIVLHEGRILDGRNRFRAAVRAGLFDADVDPLIRDRQGHEIALRAEFSRFTGKDALAYVISKNLRRRHLSESQRAMVAAKIASLGRGRPAGGDGGEKPPIGGISADGKNGSIEPFSIDRAADHLNVGRESVKRARSVQEHGAPELGQAVTRGEVSVAAAAELARLPVDEQKKVIESADPKAVAAVVRELRAKKQAEKKARRSAREAELGQRQAALPKKKFGLIYADPEWRHEPWSRETGMDRAADNHYPTSDLDTLMARDVASLAAPDSIFLLWVPVPMLIEAICILDAYGFACIERGEDGFLRPDKTRARYVSSFAWDKVLAGTGYWNRSRHEILLVATRGNPVAPAMGEQLESLIVEKRGAHSAKPEQILDWIDRTWPTTAKIELNRRGPPRPGWDAWGNEAVLAASGASPLPPDGAAGKSAGPRSRPQAAGPRQGAGLTAKLPPPPDGKHVVDFSVGGLKKGSRARLTVSKAGYGYHVHAVVEFSGFEVPVESTTVSHDYARALGDGLVEMRRLCRSAGAAGRNGMEKHHAAAGAAGARWCEKKAREWGLDIGDFSPVLAADGAAEKSAGPPSQPAAGEVELPDIPRFLRRNPDNSFVEPSGGQA